MAKECHVSYAKVFFFKKKVFSNSECRCELGDHSWPKLRRSVGMHVDLTLLHSCTFVSFVRELLCAFDHFSSAFALAHGWHNTEMHFSLSLALYFSLSVNTPPDCYLYTTSYRWHFVHSKAHALAQVCAAPKQMSSHLQTRLSPRITAGAFGAAIYQVRGELMAELNCRSDQPVSIAVASQSVSASAAALTRPYKVEPPDHQKPRW